MLRTISLYLLLFLCCSLKIEAQNIKVESFTLLENDITARVNVVRDANDDECALIKMVTTDVGYNLDEGLKREPRVGEIWFYVPQGTKRIVIRHQKLGKLVYALPETLKAKTTYQIKLPSNVEIIVHEDVGGQYLVMNVQPTDALVYIDEVLETTKAGALSKMLKYGEHMYRVEHPLYETKTGVLAIKNKKEQLAINLIPAYGYLSITSAPVGAEVTMNGKVLGRTPLKSEALREGTYRVKTFLSAYSEDVRDVTVVRGQTQNVTIPLDATFGYMEVNTTPEQGADVYINDMKVGKTPYRSNKLSEGIYKLKVIQWMYAPQEREVQIAKGQIQQILLNMNATFAEVMIRSEQPQAEIYVNDEKKGVGMWTGRMTEGFYQLSSRMESYRDGTKSVEIKAGTPQTIVVPAPTAIYGTLNITSEPTDGVIRIDGKEVGRTPELISKVLIGKRKVEILKEGCAITTQTVMIEEGKVKDLNVHLSQGKEIVFETYAPVTIKIDGVEVGSAPFKGMLSYGEHTLKVKETVEGMGVNEVFKVTESSPTEFLVRNGKFEHNGDAMIDGVSYLLFRDYGVRDRIREITARDCYTNQSKKLPLPSSGFFYFNFDRSFIGDIQGCFALENNIWKDGKWETIDISDFMGSNAKSPGGGCIVSHNGHGYLYTMKEWQKGFTIRRKDVLTNQSQILFSYETKLTPMGVLVVVDDTHLRYKGEFWTKRKNGSIKDRKEPFDFCFRIDSLPLPAVVKRSALMDKVDAQVIIAERERKKKLQEKSIIDQIDWKTFPDKSRSDDSMVFVIDKMVYLVVEKATNERKASSPNYYRDHHTVTLYKYDSQKKKWSVCAPATLLSRTSDWKHKSKPNLSFYQVEVKGKKLIFDSKAPTKSIYQYDTQMDRWELSMKNSIEQL